MMSGLREINFSQFLTALNREMQTKPVGKSIVVSSTG